MRRKFEELRENLEEFVQQDEFPMLVVGCLPEELAYVLKFFQGLEQTHPEHYLVFFPQPFTTAAAYLDGVVESIRVQIEAAGPLRQERGEEPFPPVPMELSDPRRTPEQRLFSVLQYLRTLLPNEEDHRVIVGFLPLTCSDFLAYLRLMTTIMPIAEIPAWMGALRLVAYDHRGQHMMRDAMRVHRVERVLSFEVDFSTPALTDSLSRDVANPALPVAERMTYLFQLAALDYSYKRYSDAVEKYGVLYQYYESMALPTMQSFCLLGVGDVMRAVGNHALAKQKYQQGLALAIEHKALPALLNLLISATEVSFELREFADAESYADSGTKVAAGLMNPYAYCDFHERKADAQLAQAKPAEAIATYRKAQELCQLYEYHHRWASVLERQIKLFADARMSREQRETEEMLRAVRVLEQAGTRAT